MMDRPPPRSLAELAAAERAAAPDAGAEARVWAGVEQRLLHGPPPPALPTPGAGVVLKWLGGLALVGGLVGGGALLVGDQPGPVAPPPLAEPSALAPVPEDLSQAPWPKAQVPAAPVHVPEDRSRETSPRAPVERPAATRPTTPPAANPGEPLDLAAELRLIASIRAALQRGDARLALARIAEHREKFGEDAALAQERGAHEVEAVCASGRASEARRLGEIFIARWPDSPHRARVAASCVAPEPQK